MDAIQTAAIAAKRAHNKVLWPRLELEGPVLLEQIKNDGLEQVFLTGEQISSLRVSCSSGDWLQWQKAAMGSKCAVAKIGKTVVFQAAN